MKTRNQIEVLEFVRIFHSPNQPANQQAIKFPPPALRRYRIAKLASPIDANVDMP
jgi:hypothetical protein